MGKYLDYNGVKYLWQKIFTRLLPSGGSTGQVLAKSSATNYAVGWVTPSGGGSSGKTTLYSDSTGTGANDSFLLSSSAANYDYLDFIFTDGSRQYSSRLYEPNGKSFSLSRIVVGSGNMYYAVMMGSVSGTTVTTGACAQSNSTGATISTSSTDQLKIIKVLGGTDTMSANGRSF